MCAILLRLAQTASLGFVIRMLSSEDFPDPGFGVFPGSTIRGFATTIETSRPDAGGIHVSLCQSN